MKIEFLFWGICVLVMLFFVIGVSYVLYLRRKCNRKIASVTGIVELVCEYRITWSSDLKTVVFDPNIDELLRKCGVKPDKNYLISLFNSGEGFGEVLQITLVVNAIRDYGVTSKLMDENGQQHIILWRSKALETINDVTRVVTIGTDVTDTATTKNVLSKLSRTLKEESEYFSIATENAGVGLVNIIVDGEEVFLKLSENLCAKFDFPEGDTVPIDSFMKRVKPDYLIPFQRSFNKYISGITDSLDVEVELRTENNVYHNFLLCVKNNSDVYGVYAPKKSGALIDITSHSRFGNNMTDYKDLLTGMNNRSGFMKAGTEFIENAKKSGSSCVIVCIQIERLQKITTLFGIEVTDMLIRMYSEALTMVTRKDSVLGKVGIEDFAILFYCNDRAEIERMMKEISIIIENSCDNRVLPAILKEQARFIAGACFYDGEDDITTLYNKASVTLFTGNRYDGRICCYFDSNVEEKVCERDIVEQEIGEALKHGELELYYQPKICFATGSIIGVEALMRWNHASRGMILPNEFIPVAEEIGAITKIDEWGIVQACVQNKLWQDKGYPPIKVSVNMSQAQLYQTDMVATVKLALEQSGLDPRFLELELTETMAMLDIERTISVLNQIKAIGVSISMDDFGTGYSSLSSLKMLPIDLLKIDKSLVYDIETNPTARHVTKAIVDLGKAMNLEVLAEGVESPEQRDILAELGCDVAQGFLYSKPQPAVEVERKFLIPELQAKIKAESQTIKQ